MGVYETLTSAISRKRCVRVFAEGRWRDICPQALGRKDGRMRLLAFQFDGGSVSGLAPGGQWRAFFLYEIAAASLIDGPWHTGHNVVAKTEACLDRVDIQAH
jgi:hypothetical protein